MKTSFYFVIWIIIYPLLDLTHNSLIMQNSFFVALIGVFVLSWILNRTMPGIINYERKSQRFRLVSEIESEDGKTFLKRVSRDGVVETISALYFILTTVLILFSMMKYGQKDWFTLGIFILITVGTVVRSVNLVKAKTLLRENNEKEERMAVASRVYGVALNHDLNELSFQSHPPQKPKHYKVFEVFSMIISIIAVLLGIVFIFNALLILFARDSVQAGTLAGIYFLYGSLAGYYGVRDFVAIVQSLRKKIG